ncbi:helix-turn-helix transcriptional regulator [Pararhizobium haloflavum]|uniref:helix-turn-helix transcriptional regulator n=1 Tax=Pararhizobium haloflavum TaxID=2037914 RepID=UPI000C18D127|nr:hypothetical protein [Pararhizobium haloflavum]
MSKSLQEHDIDFISNVYRSVAEGNGIEPVLAAYTRRFPDIRFSWQASLLEDNRYFAFRTFNYDERALADYLPIAHLNIMPALGARFPQERVIRSEEFLTPDEYRRTDIYNLFLRHRDNLSSSMGLFAYRTSEHAALFTVDVPARYSDRDRAALDASLAAIHPHLRQSFALMKELDLKRSRRSGTQFWIDTLPSAAFIVSRQGQISKMNAAAAKLLETRCGLSLTCRATFSFASHDQRAAIEGALRQSLSTHSASGPFAVPAPKPHRICGYCITLPRDTQIDPVLSYFRSGEADTLLVLIDASELLQSPSDDIARTLGITMAEARVVSQLCQGGDLRQAAETLGVSYHTARAQLSAAAEKLGVQRQTELVALAISASSRFPAGAAHP